MGGLDDVPWSMLVLPDAATAWVGEDRSGRVFVADRGAGGKVRAVALDRAAAAPAGNFVGAFAMADGGGGHVAVLVGKRPKNSPAFTFQVILFDKGGGTKRAISLPPLDDIVAAPQRLTIARGMIWIGGEARTAVLDGTGLLRAVIPATGAVAPNGVLLADGSAPALYDHEGRRIGELFAPPRPQGYRFLVAGANGEALVAGDTESIPEPLREKLEIIDVVTLREDGQRQLLLIDRLFAPALQFEMPEHGETPDGLPVRSYFPPQSATFDPQGNIVILEAALDGLRLYRHQRIPPDLDWREKFICPDDLNCEERSMASAEYLTRLGRPEEAGALAQVFSKMAWLARVNHTPPPAGTANDPVFAKLRKSLTTRR